VLSLRHASRKQGGKLCSAVGRAQVMGEVSTASVACGVLGVGGNKGAVAVSFTMQRCKCAAICSHFAAHQVCELAKGV
jgi:hypothetical protein